MFWTFYLLALAGFVIALLMSAASFASSWKYQHNFHTIRDYWKWNGYYDVAGLILCTVVCFLLTIPGGGEWLISWFTNGQVTNDMPAGFYVTAFFVGALHQFIISKMRGIFKPIPPPQESNP